MSGKMREKRASVRCAARRAVEANENAVNVSVLTQECKTLQLQLAAGEAAAQTRHDGLVAYIASLETKNTTLELGLTAAKADNVRLQRASIDERWAAVSAVKRENMEILAMGRAVQLELDYATLGAANDRHVIDEQKKRLRVHCEDMKGMRTRLLTAATRHATALQAKAAAVENVVHTTMRMRAVTKQSRCLQGALAVKSQQFTAVAVQLAEARVALRQKRARPKVRSFVGLFVSLSLCRLYLCSLTGDVRRGRDRRKSQICTKGQIVASVGRWMYKGRSWPWFVAFCQFLSKVFILHRCVVFWYVGHVNSIAVHRAVGCSRIASAEFHFNHENKKARQPPCDANDDSHSGIGGCAVVAAAATSIFAVDVTAVNVGVAGATRLG